MRIILPVCDAPQALSSRPERSEVEGSAFLHDEGRPQHSVIPSEAEGPAAPRCQHFVIPTGARDLLSRTRKDVPNTLSSRLTEGPAAPRQHFVIPTGAKRSGGTCFPARRRTSPTLCHPDRSGRTCCSALPTLCHPDRSEAERRDLLSCTTKDVPNTPSSRRAEGPAAPRCQHFVIPTGAKRSGGTCFPARRRTFPTLCHPDRSGRTCCSALPTLCHPDRSGRPASRPSGSGGTCFPARGRTFPTLCHPERSRGTCGRRQRHDPSAIGQRPNWEGPVTSVP